MLVGLLLSLALAVADAAEQSIETFDADTLPPNLTQNHVRAVLVNGVLRVDFAAVDWPNVCFTPPPGKTWNWSDYAGLAVDVTNPGPEAVDVCIRIDNAGADGANHCNTARTDVAPGETKTFRAWMNVGDGDTFWGMRGVPERGPVSQGPIIDPSRITAFQVFLPLPEKPRTLILDNIRLFGRGGPLEALVPMPFVDRYGQYKHADWPGKLRDDADIIARRDAEERDLSAAPQLPGRNRFGGWADGPQLESTGWFRAEQVDGRWWLVDPDGRLFFSVGVDCVGTWEHTFIEGRQEWFEWLPKPEGPYEDFFGHQSNVHSMAEKIGGQGRTFNWYAANLYRKYGDDWRRRWREVSAQRLRAWGFNTIGNWSQDDVIALKALPYTATAGVTGDFREVEGGRGYWGRMKDPYDLRFADAADASIARAARKHADDPFCIGYFVDNELSWGSPSGHDIAVWALASPADQPCRIAFVDSLKAKYADLDGLNRAWATNADDWDSLRAPARPNEACAADMDAFIYAFARRYFDAVKAAIDRHAPNQLYLGCRFAGKPCDAVVRACAEVADVVSVNLYQRAVDGAQWIALGKPILIGEFHFGALDRGHFHTGLVPTRNQQERAESYIRYVRSVADCPAFVGCHWFQYVDDPLTGRTYDGENYNIGFVTVTDTPYPEMVEAAKTVHAEVYERRHGR